MSECSSNQLLKDLKSELSGLLWVNLFNGKHKIEQPMSSHARSCRLQEDLQVSECSSIQLLDDLNWELSDFLWVNLFDGKRKKEQPMSGHARSCKLQEDLQVSCALPFGS